MSEITKLYKNAGVEKFEPKEHFSLEDCEEYCLDNNCSQCGWRKCPPFTAEKQLELIKWLANRGSCELIIQGHPKANLYKIGTNFINRTIASNFAEVLANFVNNLWQDLREEERKQIKEILNEF